MGITLIESIQAEVRKAARERNKTAALQGMVLIHADEIRTWGDVEGFSKSILPDNYMPVMAVRPMLKTQQWLRDNGYEIVKIKGENK